MNEIIKKMTFGKPHQIIRPALWIFFEDFFNMFPAVIVYIAINMIAKAFYDYQAINMHNMLILSGLLIVLCIGDNPVFYWLGNLQQYLYSIG